MASDQPPQSNAQPISETLHLTTALSEPPAARPTPSIAKLMQTPLDLVFEEGAPKEVKQTALNIMDYQTCVREKSWESLKKMNGDQSHWHCTKGVQDFSRPTSRSLEMRIVDLQKWQDPKKAIEGALQCGNLLTIHPSRMGNQ